MKLLKKRAAIKSIGGIVLLLVIFFAVVSVIGFNSFTEALLSQYSEGAFLTAETAARILDADRMDEYEQSGGTGEEYMEVWNQLDQLCNSSGATFISPRSIITAALRNTTSGMSGKRRMTNTGRSTACFMTWRRTGNW